MKRDYMRPCLARMDMEAEGIILDGSYTNRAIKINSVEVDPFDAGFVDGSGNEIPFQDISFD